MKVKLGETNSSRVEVKESTLELEKDLIGVVVVVNCYAIEQLRFFLFLLFVFFSFPALYPISSIILKS